MYEQINDFTIYGKLEVFTMYFLLDKKAKIYFFFFKNTDLLLPKEKKFFCLP